MDRHQKQLVDAIKGHVEVWKKAGKPKRTDKEAAIACKIHPTALSNILAAKGERLTRFNLEKLAKGLGLSWDEEARLAVMALENEWKKDFNLVPSKEQPKQKAKRVKREVEEALGILLNAPDTLEKLESVHAFLAIHFNPNLRRHVKEVISFADKLRPLDGIRRKKKTSEAEREMKKLKAARKVQGGVKDTKLDPFTTDLELI